MHIHIYINLTHYFLFFPKQETPVKQRRSFTSPKDVLRHYRKHRDRVVSSKRMYRECVGHTSSNNTSPCNKVVHRTPAVRFAHYVNEDVVVSGNAAASLRFFADGADDDHQAPPPYFQSCPTTSTPITKSPPTVAGRLTHSSGKPTTKRTSPLQRHQRLTKEHCKPLCRKTDENRRNIVNKETLKAPDVINTPKTSNQMVHQ